MSIGTSICMLIGMLVGMLILMHAAAGEAKKTKSAGGGSLRHTAAHSKNSSV